MIIKKKLKFHINKKTKKKFTYESDLVRQEIIDSFGLIELVNFIEKDLKYKCPIDKISITNFNTINNITKFVMRYNKKR